MLRIQILWRFWLSPLGKGPPNLHFHQTLPLVLMWLSRVYPSRAGTLYIGNWRAGAWSSTYYCVDLVWTCHCSRPQWPYLGNGSQAVILSRSESDKRSAFGRLGWWFCVDRLRPEIWGGRKGQLGGSCHSVGRAVTREDGKKGKGVVSERRERES